uniref:Uncharacterized protein n=1 Tax=Pararge aegeria TaxID=116150 RepID=S4P5U0_9NEOP
MFDFDIEKSSKNRLRKIFRCIKALSNSVFWKFEIDATLNHWYSKFLFFFHCFDSQQCPFEIDIRDAT